MSEHLEIDDSTLLNDFRDTRSESAFTELVRRHLPLVFHVALRRLESAALAEEAAQHAFTRLAAKVAVVSRHPERLRAWLHRTAYFEASTLARKETRLSRLPVTPETPTEPMNRPEIYDRLDEALNRLPDLDRELVLRHCCGGEDYRRMAAAVGKSEAACQKRVERALARLAQGMGGARTAGAVFAAFAATNLKGQAMPSAERVALAALNQHTAVASVTGAVSGMKLAACAVLALAGGAAGWHRSEAPVTPPPEVRSVAVRSRTVAEKPPTNTADPVLASRAVNIDRSLNEVLESIQAGRLAPLIGFLPRATVDDLRAIIAEDDLGELSEGMGGFLTAHNLAVLRWVELDPAGAFRYGNSRSNNIATATLAKWLEADPTAAAAAFLALSPPERLSIAGHMVTTNDSVAGKLAAIDPGVAWKVEEERVFNPDPAAELENAASLVDRILTGNRRDEPAGSEAEEIGSAFYHLAQKDPESAIAQAKLLPWQGLHNRVLFRLYQNHPPSSAGLAPGPLRVQAIARETEQLMESDPEAAVRRLLATPPGAERNAIYEEISENLAGSDPWRLLEIVSSANGFLDGNDDPLKRALEFAGRTDPQRALALLPDITSRLDNFGGTHELAKTIVSGWLQTDAAAAIAWAAQAGVWLDSEELAKAHGGAQELIDLLESPDKQVARMAKEALKLRLEADLKTGNAGGLLDKIPQEVADDMLMWIAADACAAGVYQEGLRIAELLSPAAREREGLGRMALLALRRDPEGGLEWLKSLPAADQKAVISGMNRTLEKWKFDDEAELRQALQLLNP